MKLTINQIAELAQVSKGTVSKVLNGHPGIGQATRDRILKLVKQLDYRPDASARALALKRSGIIGFLIPHTAATSLAGHYWTVVLAGISQTAAERGYQVLILTPPRDGNLQAVVDSVLKSNAVDGLIIGSELLDPEGLTALILHKIPFVLLGQNPDFPHYCIEVDTAAGTRKLAEHMIHCGYRNIGALFGPAQYPYTQQRRKAFQETMAAHGLNSHRLLHSGYGSPQNKSDWEAFLTIHPDLDSLLLASGGGFLLDVLTVLQKMKRVIPQFGLGVIDDYPFMQAMTPPITALRQPLFLAGQESFHLLRRLLDDDPPPEPVMSLESTLIVRESCGERPTPEK